jgi:hypothetical protein
MASKEKQFRVAILCRGYSFDAWEAECIRQVMSLPFVEIVLLIAEPGEENIPKTFLHKLSHYPYRNILWRFYKRFKIKIDAYKTVSLEAELKDTPLIYCKAELKGKYSQYFSEIDLDKIKSHQPDVLLRFAYNILRGEILTVAKHGVWSYHHADEQIIRGGPAAFWEIHNKIPVTGAILQRLTEKLDSGIILRKGYFKTISRSYSVNLEQLIKGSTSWMKQALIDLANGNLPANLESQEQSSAKVYSFPTNAQMICAWRISKAAKMKFHWHELFQPEQWNVGIIKQNPSEIISKGITSKIEWLPEPKTNEYYADPFGWRDENELKIVFEHYNYKKQKGIIASYNSNGEIKTVLEKTNHLSYPFVFNVNGKKAIMPECFESKNLFFFDVNNPQEEKIIIENIDAVDSTPVFHNNRWWIFCTLADEFSNTNLFLYHSEKIDGAWIAHENNPVKCDIRSSRPGGTPFVLNGKLFRPAQDCSTSYGSAIVINEIVLLDENSFSERIVARIEPDINSKYNKGIHTFSLVDNNTILLDGKRYVYNFDNFKNVFKRKLARIF